MNNAPIPGRLVNVVFGRVLASDLTPAVRDSLKEIGLDLAHMAHDYPRQTWYRAVVLTAEALFPSMAPDVQLRELGGHLIERLHSRNIMKGPWLAMAKLAGPRRVLKQASQFDASAMPVSVEVLEHGSRDVELTVNETEQLPFLEGLLNGFVGLLGGRQVTVQVTPPANGSTSFRMTWK